MTAAYVEDTDRLGLGPARPRAARPARRSAPIVELIEDLIESGHAYAAGGDVYFRVASFPGYGKLSNRPLEEMQQGEGDDAAELKESPQDFALWKARKEGEDTAWELALGRGPAGLAHRVLGDGRGDPRASTSRSTAAAPTSSSPTTRTRSPRPRPPAASRWPGSGCTTAWCEMGAEKMAKSVGNIRLLHGALDEYGRDAVVMWFVGGHYRQPLAFSADALDGGGGRRASAARAGPPARPGAAPADDGSTRSRSASSTPWPTTSTPRRRARCCSSGSARPTGVWTPASALGPGGCAEMLHALGLERLLDGGATRLPTRPGAGR